MKRTLKLKIPRSSATTAIHLSLNGLFEKKLPELIESTGKSCAILTDSSIHAKYAKELEILDCKVFSFPAGEASKTRETKAMLEDLLLAHHFGKDCCIIGLGGGVTCDIAGFVASTYCRGVSLNLIPTTLIAMVDACVGGKNSINTPYGKNMIGTFYNPERVLISGEFLKTLPSRELKSGIAEIIKYGLIDSKELFEELLQNRSKFDALDMPWVMKIIYEGLRIKIKVVEEDPFEKKGRRRILNFGHTIGHAIEKLENYALPHGQAVAMGMIVSAFISMEMGLLKKADLEDIEAICRDYQIPLKLSKPHQIDDLLSTLALDKKAQKATPRFVLLKEIGKPHPFEGEYCTEVPFEILEKAIAWMNKRFASSQVN